MRSRQDGVTGNVEHHRVLRPAGFPFRQDRGDPVPLDDKRAHPGIGARAVEDEAAVEDGRPFGAARSGRGRHPARVVGGLDVVQELPAVHDLALRLGLGEGQRSHEGNGKGGEE